MPVPFPRPFLHVTLGLLIVGAFAAPASADATISGQVVDPDGRPVAGAHVILSGDQTPLQSVRTGGDGRFTIRSPETGRLALRVAADGFSAEPIALDGSRDARELGTITLAVGALSESIVVSASQVEVPLTEVSSSVTVIGAAELQARQIHSVADALRAVPGLAVASTGGAGTTTGVFPRGGESNYMLALVDGVPVNAFGGDFDFAQLSTANVERIEIVRGPQSALFGSNAIGGVVRIVTRSGGRPTAQVSAEGGHYGTSRLSVSTTGQRHRFEWGASYDQFRSDGMNGEHTPAGATILNDDYDRKTGSVSAGWRDGSASLRAELRHSRDERGFPGPFGSNPVGAYGGIDAISRGNNDRSVASVSTVIPLSARIRTQGQVGFSRLDSDFTSPFGPSESYSRRWSGRLQTDMALRPGVDLSSGLELQRERARSTFITGVRDQQIPIERWNVGYFGEARWNWRNRLFASTGLRVEDIRREHIEEAGVRPPLASDTTVSINPRVSLAWILSSARHGYTKVRGAVGTGIRAPDAFEIAFTDNPELRPERSRSAEIGIDQAFARGRALVEATAFFNEYDDLIVAVGPFTGSSRYRTDNISNARARGLELAVTWRGRFPARLPVDFSGRLGYTRLASRILAVDQDDDAPPPFVVGQALLRRPGHQFFADFSASAGAISAFLRGGGRSAALDVEPSLGTFGGLFDANGYQVWHGGAAWRFTRISELFGRVENLFDRAYEEALGFPALGRRMTVGLRIAAAGF